jgi:hypothetical protein
MGKEAVYPQFSATLVEEAVNPEAAPTETVNFGKFTNRLSSSPVLLSFSTAVETKKNSKTKN